MRRARSTRWSAHAREAAPAECCGLLLGRAARDRRGGAARATSPTSPTTRFLIDPEGSLRRRGATRGAAGSRSSASITRIRARRPSRRNAIAPSVSYPGHLYLIVSLRAEPAEVGLFRFDAGNFHASVVRHSRLNAQVRRRLLAGAWLCAVARRPRSAPRTCRLRRRVVARFTITGAEEIAPQAHPATRSASRSASRSPIRPSTSPSRCERQYRDEGYTFARVKAAFDAVVRRAVARRRRRRRSTASSSRASTKSWRARSPTSSRCAPATSSTAGAPGRRSTCCCGRRVAPSARAACTRADVHRQRRRVDGGTAPSISSIATASASCSSACASRPDASGCCRISASARTGSRRSTASCRRSAWASRSSITIASITPSSPATFPTRSRRSAPATRSGSSGRSSARRSCIVGGELHDLTASDDQWQLSSLEASLAAVGPRAQLSATTTAAAACRSTGRCACTRRSKRWSPGAASARSRCATTSDFSLWNGDEPFRPNTRRAATAG